MPRPWARENGARTLKGHGFRMAFGGFCLIKRPLGASGFIFESRGAEADQACGGIGGVDAPAAAAVPDLGPWDMENDRVTLVRASFFPMSVVLTPRTWPQGSPFWRNCCRRRSGSCLFGLVLLYGGAFRGECARATRSGKWNGFSCIRRVFHERLLYTGETCSLSSSFIRLSFVWKRGVKDRSDVLKSLFYKI